MDPLRELAEEHARVTRRHFLETGAAATAAVPWAAWSAGAAEIPPSLAQAAADMPYLTEDKLFRGIGRGEPAPHTLSEERRREVGLHPDTWQLEVLADPASDSEVANPLTKELGTALRWKDLMALAEKHAVRFLAAMTCTNVPNPFGNGLWEGVPLREIIALAKPGKNVRRVYYYGYHNDDPKQRFQSSLSLNRVLEDPPGEYPVVLCYKMNGEWLSPERGAPARMVVADAYANKSVKWIQRIVLTNDFHSNDTYAEWNNDTESPRKTYARFVQVPESVKAGAPFPITGIAQVGMAGLSHVQYWLCPENTPLSEDDPYFTSAAWKDAVLLPPPAQWGGGIPEGALSPAPLQFRAEDGRPAQWPMRNTLAHWAALLENVPAGRYHLRCRTIDNNGTAQPLPRPYLKSGNNAIQKVDLIVEA